MRPETEEPKEEMSQTERSETRYMGEGEPGLNPDNTEMSEAAYMGEPEEENQGKHETEYNKGRGGPRIGKATLHMHKEGERRESA